MDANEHTTIYRTRQSGSGQSAEEAVGYIDASGVINRYKWGQGLPVGRVDSNMHIFRTMQYGEREIGQALPSGAVRSAGVLEGGDVGWMDPDGVVIQGGLIMGEEEVGRVQGPLALSAAAALLLLFLPDEAEANRRAAR